MNDKQHKPKRERKKKRKSIDWDRWGAELRAADELDAGEEADLPEGVPLPEAPGSVVAIFIKRKRGGR